MASLNLGIFLKAKETCIDGAGTQRWTLKIIIFRWYQGLTWKANIILYEICVMKKLWIAVNSTSFLLIVIRYEMTIFIEWCSMSSKTFLKGFLKKKSFFCGMLAIQSDTYWRKISSNLQNLFWSPYVKRFSQRSQIGEIKIIQILLFIVWSLKLIAPKNYYI